MKRSVRKIIIFKRIKFVFSPINRLTLIQRDNCTYNYTVYNDTCKCVKCDNVSLLICTVVFDVERERGIGSSSMRVYEAASQCICVDIKL